MQNRPSTLNLAECSLDSGTQKKVPGEALALQDRVSESNPRKLEVIKLWINPRVLLAKDPLTGEEFHVIVGRNGNFVHGMEVPTVPDERNAGFWRLVGPLPPRRGRWW